MASREMRLKLNSNAVDIAKKLTVDEVFLSYFQKYRIFTDLVVENILNGNSSERRRKFIQKLSQKDEKTWPYFIKALVETCQKELAEILDLEESRKYGSEATDASLVVKNTMELSDEQSRKIEKLFADDSKNNYLYYKAEKSTMKQDALTLKGVNEEKTIYDTLGKEKGLVLILNNQYYYALTERNGTEYDEQNIRTMFESLNYEVECMNDLISSNFQKQLEDMKMKINKSNYKSFIFFVLAHGKENAFLLCDHVTNSNNNATVVQLEFIFEYFGSDNCKGLAGKPKLYFIQACQGTKEELAFKSETPKKVDQKIREGSSSINPQRSECDETDASSSDKYKEDFLAVYSTVSGFVSYRLESNGTWFIRALITVLKVKAHTSEIMDIIQEVRNVISKKLTTMEFHVEGSTTYLTPRIQQVASFNHLEKKFYFLP